MGAAADCKMRQLPEKAAMKGSILQCLVILKAQARTLGALKGSGFSSALGLQYLGCALPKPSRCQLLAICGS